ncbi:MAG: hypothetical protein HC876_14790 [Chloroflexaceae bacterium]|nr:hypothetical protein [Chloroflexaceae bacterium]NJO06677.1 hypothetical protein [Chloroflexaceae bacterium]
MNVQVLSIDIQSDITVLVLKINEQQHTFCISVDEYKGMLGVNGDAQFQAAFQHRPMIAREIVRLVGEQYRGNHISFPIDIYDYVPATAK